MSHTVHRDFLRALGLGLGVAGADQLSKWLVEQHLPAGHGIPVIPGFFTLVHLHNTGAAWSLFTGRMAWLALISLVVLAGMLWYFRQLSGGFSERVWALGLIYGGIAGNLVDRVCRSGVVDFLAFNLFGYPWPAFNVADSAICVGVAIYIASSFFRPEPAPPPPAA